MAVMGVNDMTKRTGQCMCGAVAFKADTPDKFAACYCKMCQRWASGMFAGVHTTEFEVTKGADVMTVFKSSEWATRAFCSCCGSNIYYKADEMATPAVALGTFDDTEGLINGIRYFIDMKPEGLTLKGDVKSMTEAECMAHFAPDEG